MASVGATRSDGVHTDPRWRSHLRTYTDPQWRSHRLRFLFALLRGGAPVIAEAASSPTRGWTRAVPEVLAADGVLVGACRYVLLVPLAYRVVTIPVMLLFVLAANGSAQAGPVFAIAGTSMVLNVLTALWVSRLSGFRTALLYLDVAVALGINLVTSLIVPDPDYAEAGELAWTYLIGSVALFTLLRGVLAAIVLILASIPLHPLLIGAGGHAGFGRSSVLGVVTDLATLLAPLAVAVTLLIALGVAVRLALDAGVRRGRDAEHARGQRNLHDTVLQTLEAMALCPPNAPTDLAGARRQLTELRGMARAQAMRLRHSLTEPIAGGSGAGLAEDLAELAADMAREGLRARLVCSDEGAALSQARRLAVRDAVREAMRNTMKHAGTDEVVVRVERRDGGIAVIARDHGIGFSEAERPAGFGISESIAARLAEVGGSAVVESEPGRGTRVTLWVPL